MFLTDRQRKVLAFLHSEVTERGRAPTLREIAEHFGIATVTAYQHVRALAQKGAVRRLRHHARSIELAVAPSDKPQRETRLPIAGRLLAGGKLEYVAKPEEFDPLELLPKERHGHVARVVGDHLAGDGFRDGELLVIEPRSAARPGELVLATLQDGSFVIRRLERGAVDDALVPRRNAPGDRRDAIAARRAKILGVVKAGITRFGPE